MSFPISKCSCSGAAPVGPALAENCGGSAIWVFMTILEAYLSAKCDIDDACSRVTSRIRSTPDTTYDFVVIGGGTAGSVVASRLSENQDWKVLLIEAGEDEPIGAQVPSMLTYFGSNIDWQYKTEKEKAACLNNDGVCNWPRGKVLGGTSVINGMMYIRGNPEDYDNWARLGNPGWKYMDVLPFFKYSENNLQINKVGTEFHSAGGLLQISQFPHRPLMADKILKGAKELGYNSGDLNGLNSTGFMIAQTLSKNGVRHSAARAFLRPARNRKNFHILVNTTAARVLIDPVLKYVRGVEVIDNKTGERRKINVKKEVVISGGAVNSPQILMLSGVGPKDELKKVNVNVIHDLPGVGKNLMNHVSYSINFLLKEKDVNTLNWNTALQYIRFRNGAMSGTGLSQVTGKIVSPFAEKRGVPDIQFYFGGYLSTCSQDGLVGGLSSNGSRSISMSPTVLHPKSRGYLTLASNNPLDHPRIVPNYLTHEHDVKVLKHGIRTAIKLSKTTPLRKLGMRLDTTPVKGCERFTFDSDDYWECAIRRDTAPENHQAGSCKMGQKTDVNAVVDFKLRVHGIKGLRVMDTSIMPEVTSGNTMAPAIMIAEKGVAMIKDYWCNQRQNDWSQHHRYNSNEHDDDSNEYDNNEYDSNEYDSNESDVNGWYNQFDEHHPNRNHHNHPHGGHRPNGGQNGGYNGGYRHYGY